MQTGDERAEDDVSHVSVSKLQALCDPFLSPCWPINYPITTLEVLDAVGRGISQAPDLDGPPTHDETDRGYHISRVAWFVLCGWNDPIDIDVGVPELGCYVHWKVVDGNHRFAAAIILGHKTIPASIAGSVGYATELGLTDESLNARLAP